MNIKTLRYGILIILGFNFWANIEVVAAEVSAELQVRLQSSMLRHLDQVTTDGTYTYVDTKRGEIRIVYPANFHPFVVAIADNYFVCAEMIDDEGETVTADFLVREVGGEYRVVQMIVDNRESVQKALGK